MKATLQSVKRSFAVQFGGKLWSYLNVYMIDKICKI